ncbi:MAG: 1-(5-phosphoribosyl)-5-[Clostridia bacterium]|nr:1-(5-phosphoribosyl)-5-[(5-phosphoribosylamino)methylideneamino]imidazole-4-carboxamide isomerase [Clostridia bacterium]
MLIFPAIDLYQGCAVRLFKGDYDQVTVYSRDPAAVALGFRQQGASWLHMVDLEGARDGGTPNFDWVCRAAKESGLQVQIGGGVRDERVVERYLSAGVSRVILGTAAVENRPFLTDMVNRYGDRIAVGVDVREGLVAVRGWKELSRETLQGFCGQLQEIGVQTVICTDISRDGAMQGTNRDLYRALSRQYGMRFIASGGVSTIEDVKALKDMDLYGAIVGKALYTGAIDLKQAIEEAT